MAVSNQRMIFKKFADRLMPGSRVALLKSAADNIRFGVVDALFDDPYFWYITGITLRSLGNIEK